MGFWKSDERGGRMTVRRNGKSRQYGWLSGVLLGVIFLGSGAAQGQFGVICRKAVMICLECIGIG